MWCVRRPEPWRWRRPSGQAHRRRDNRPRRECPAPRAGKPDLNGLWQALNTANYDIQAHGPGRPWRCARARRARSRQGSDRARRHRLRARRRRHRRRWTIPYLPAALEKKKKNQEHWLALDPEIKCYLPGVPRATYMPFPLQIFQSESAFFIAYEYASAVRNIYLKDPGPPPVDSWMGQSWGRWEGDTFVVEVERLQRSDVVRPRRQFPQRADDGGRSATP